MKIKINPKYEEMRSFIERIPDVFEQEGRCIFEGRNVIKAFHVKFDGKEKEVVVKSLSFPYNRFDPSNTASGNKKRPEIWL